MTTEFPTPQPINPNDPNGDAAAIDAAAGEGMVPEVTPPTGAPLSPAEQLAAPPQSALPPVEAPAPAPAPAVEQTAEAPVAEPAQPAEAPIEQILPPAEQTVVPTEVSSLPTAEITPVEEIARMDGEGGGQQLPAA